MKKRVDVLLVERGLVETRAKAQALVLAGLVPGYDKPGQQVRDDVELVVERPPRFVSRAGEKLAHALDVFGVDPAGRACLDIGASTGGFTDCLLQRGAKCVIALDVGYGQLHPKLRDDPRVIVLERTNARHLTELPFRTGAHRVRRLVHRGREGGRAGAAARGARMGGARAREAPIRGRPCRGARRASSATPTCTGAWWRRSAAAPLSGAARWPGS